MNAVICLWTSLAILGGEPPAQAEARQPGRELGSKAIAHLKNQEMNLKSISLTYSFQDMPNFLEGKEPQMQRRVYRYFGSGEKRRTEEDNPERNFDNESPYYQIDVYTGERHFQHFPGHKKGVMVSDRPFGVNYFNFVYQAGEKLSKILEENAAKAEVAPIEEGGNKLVAFRWVDEQPQVRTVSEYVLDPAAGYQPRRISRRFYAPGMSWGGDKVDYHLHETRVSKYLQSGDNWFPQEFVTAYEAFLEGGKSIRKSELSVKLLECLPNANLPPELFELHFPNGTTVSDGDLRVVYEVGVPNSKRPLVETPEPVGSEYGVPPVRLAQYRSRILLAAVVTALAAAVAYLLLRRRTRGA